MRRLILLALATAIAGLTLAGSAQAELKAIWGPNRLPNGDSAFPLYEKLGVDVLQIQLLWDRVASARPARPKNPNDPAYVWPAELDQAVREARRRHFRIALMVKGTPAWANSGGPPTQAPDRLDDYSDFLQAASRRYPRVRHWMIWGEPMRSANWTPLPPNSPVGPRAYARLLDRAYGRLKKLDRRNIVIGGMTFTIGDLLPTEYLRWMRLPNGKPPRLDWFGHNAFGTRKPNLLLRPYFPGLRDFSDLDTYHREIKRAYRSRHRAPKIWVSEFAVSSDRANRAFDFYVSRKAQASWLAAAFRIGHRTSWIAGVGWFKLYDDPGRNSITTGLLDARGKKKPAFDAYRRAR